MKLPLWMFRWLHRRRLTRHGMRGSRLHGWLGDRVLDRSLWAPTRESVARAWLVGFPITVVPFLPLQSVLAGAATLAVRGNLLLAIVLQFISNPFTAPVQISGCYLVGELGRGRAPSQVWHQIADTPSDLLTHDTLLSLYLGAVIVGTMGGALGYVFIRALWRRDAPRQRNKER